MVSLSCSCKCIRPFRSCVDSRSVDPTITLRHCCLTLYRYFHSYSQIFTFSILNPTIFHVSTCFIINPNFSSLVVTDLKGLARVMTYLSASSTESCAIISGRRAIFCECASSTYFHISHVAHVAHVARPFFQPRPTPLSGPREPPFPASVLSWPRHSPCPMLFVAPVCATVPVLSQPLFEPWPNPSLSLVQPLVELLSWPSLFPALSQLISSPCPSPLSQPLSEPGPAPP